jgi:Mechanosensitive ion channel, conserved TM helix
MWNQVGGTLSNSMAQAMGRFASLLPGILAFLVSVVLFSLIGWVLAWVVRRILIALRFDERMGRGTEAVTEWSPRQTPAGLAARLVFWLFVVIGIAVGVDAFGASSNSTIAVGLLAYLPKLIGAGVILLVGNIVARFLSRGVLIGAVNMNLQYARLLSLGVKWLVLVLTAAMALDHLEIGEKIVDIAFAILFGGIVLSLALSVGLGSRELVSRSIERETSRAAAAPAQEEEQLRHF